MNKCRDREGLLLLILTAAFYLASAQDPAAGVIDVQAGLKPQINTPASTADLFCESKRMVVNLTFAQPFFGKIFAENLPTDAACIRDFTGTRGRPGGGLRSLSYYIPLKECGTNQLGQGRDFENTFQIRYGPNTDTIQPQDERKTILCRYPPPVVPAPLPIPPPPAAIPPVIPKASVSELELLLIIAAVLFLGLLLFGLCCAWCCCKRRAAAAKVQSEGVLIEQPEVLKLAGTTVPFETIRIPRANNASVSGSDVSETALINRLEGAESPEIFPIVPHGDNEILRIPHVTQLSKGYELQEATMIIPPGGQSISEGDLETKTEITETEVDHRAVYVPPVPLRPPSPRPGAEFEQESRSDLMELDVEHTLIAGRRPQWPPEQPLDMRSITEMSEESITRRTVIPKPPPVPKLPPKMTMTELETEQHSVTESLENELILRAVPKKQPRLMPPPQRNQYPFDTRTETTIIEEETQRVFPPRPPVQTTTTRTGTEVVVRRAGQRTVPQPVVEPPATTTRNVKETNIRRMYDIYPDRPPPIPPVTTTTTTRDTDIHEDYEFIPASRPVYQPPTSATRTTKETDIQREYEFIPGQPPVRRPYPPYSTTQTSTETEVFRDYEAARPVPPRAPRPLTTTTTTVTEEREDLRAPERRYPYDQTGRKWQTSEQSVHEDHELYAEPRFPPAMEPLVSTMETVDRRFLRRPFPLAQDTRETWDTYDVVSQRLDDIRRGTEYPPYSTMTTMDERRDIYGYPTAEERYISTATRNIQKEMDIGTPPKSSTPDTTLDAPGYTNGRTRLTDVQCDLNATPPTLIPRPFLREPLTSTTRTATTTEVATRRDSRQSSVSDFPHAQPTIRPFATPPEEFNEPRPPVSWADIQRVLQEPFRDYTSLSRTEILPQHDIDRLRDLMHYDQEFQLNITRVRTVYDLYYIRYLPPYDTYFVRTSWTIIIRIFIRILELPRPHTGDPDFIEPRPEWFARPYPVDRTSDTESNATSGPSFAERALSEFTEVSHVVPRPLGVLSDGSDAGSSWFGSVARRGGPSEFDVAERSVTEFFENAPTVSYSRTYREERGTRTGGFGREGHEENLSEL